MAQHALARRGRWPWDILLALIVHDLAIGNHDPAQRRSQPNPFPGCCDQEPAETTFVIITRLCRPTFLCSARPLCHSIKGFAASQQGPAEVGARSLLVKGNSCGAVSMAHDVQRSVQRLITVAEEARRERIEEAGRGLGRHKGEGSETMSLKCPLIGGQVSRGGREVFRIPREFYGYASTHSLPGSQ